MDKCRDWKLAISLKWEGIRSTNLVYGWSMEIRIDVHDDLQVESSEWLFNSPLAGGEGILWWQQHRPSSLFILQST